MNISAIWGLTWYCVDDPNDSLYLNGNELSWDNNKKYEPMII